MKEENRINEELLRFWDEAMRMTEEEMEKETKAGGRDPRRLAPSLKLYEAVCGLGSCANVLDYGCGTGWAAIAAAKSGCRDVTAADVGEHIAETASFFADLFGVRDRIRVLQVPTEWLKTVPAETYDGLVCSNVLDVVPYGTAREILKEFGRITRPGASVVIGLNFYLSEEAARAKGLELADGRYLFVDGVLRLSSSSDAEWEEAFAPFFRTERTDHFAWPGEKKETRRMFVLKRKDGLR